MMGQLIKASGREMYFALNGFAQHTGVSHAAIVVHIGVARIKGHGILAVLRLNCGEFFRDSFIGFVPADLNPIVTLLLDWQPQAIRVGVDILHGRALGANITPAERVIFIALDGQHLLSLSFYFKSTYGLT